MTDGSLGELAPVRADETTTDRYGLPLTRGASDLDATRQARAWLLRAKRAREPTAIVAACLVLVDNLLDRHRVHAASWAIEDALEALAKIGDVTGGDEAAWSLHLTLAVLYDRLGDGMRARRTARRALHEARRADSSVGLLRCRELLDRFAAGPHPSAAANDRATARRSA